MKINFQHKGNFNKLEKFLVRGLKIKPITRMILDKYGKQGVEALRNATPKDTGKTADSWYYTIEEDAHGNPKIVWANSNIADGRVNVAILLQYGHATRNGGFVKGTDYINPAINSVFQKMADEAWKEVNSNG